MLFRAPKGVAPFGFHFGINNCCHQVTLVHGSSIPWEQCRSPGVFPSMNERHTLSDTKMSAISRQNALKAEKAGSEGIGRALMTIFPAAREHTLPEDMKRLLNEIGWSDQDCAGNSSNAI